MTVVDEIAEVTSICRICLEEGCAKKLIKPCNCKGSMGSVHVYCLENWLNVKNIQKCEVCNEEYKIQRILKYGRLRSLFPYVRLHKSAIMNNLLCIVVLFIPTIFANFIIIHIYQNLKCENFSSFIKVYFSLVWLFLHYFLSVESFYEIYDLYHSWRAWRMSVFTIRVN